jgi:hypothetical protein
MEYWSTGVLEEWSVGVLRCRGVFPSITPILHSPIAPTSQYSTTPSLQYQRHECRYFSG